MPTYQAKNNEIVMIDPSQGWTVDAPLSPVNNDRFTIRTLTEDITPVTINGQFPGGTTSFYLIWPFGAIEFCYATGGPYWFTLATFPPESPKLAGEGDGWNPGTLDATYVTADLTFDAAVTKYITFDDTANTFRYLIPGIYQLILNGTFEHNALNAGRTTNFRIFNVTDGVADTPTLLATGRNVEATSFTGAVLLDVDSTLWNKDIRIEFGGGDSYSTVTFNALDLQTISIDPNIFFPITP